MQTIAIGIALLMATLDASAAIYKCQQGGQLVYSDKPCPSATTIDTTNGKAPPLADQYRARARSLREQAAVLNQEAAESREAMERNACQRTIRNHNWTMKTAAKYKNDEWWRAAGYDSEEHLLKKCGKYLIPTGAK